MAVHINREKLIKYLSANNWKYDASLDWWESPIGNLYHMNLRGLLIPLSEAVPT